MRPGALTDQLGDFIGSLQASLLSDPSDYTVAADGTIEVHPLETLGHYADWLGIKTQRLRDILRSRNWTSAQELVEEVFRAVREFSDADPPLDDQTVVAVVRKTQI